MFTVLLVDDSAPIRLMASRLLESKGYTVTACDSAESALHALSDMKPDVFIVDVVMPGMDGFTFVKTIRSDPRWQDTPVLFLSSADNPDDRLRGYRLGAEDFIPKSSGPEEILLRMERA